MTDKYPKLAATLEAGKKLIDNRNNAPMENTATLQASSYIPISIPAGALPPPSGALPPPVGALPYPTGVITQPTGALPPPPFLSCKLLLKT